MRKTTKLDERNQVNVSLSRVRLFVTPWTVAHQMPLSIEFFRQEYWSGLPFPSAADLPYPGIVPIPTSPALQVDSLPPQEPMNFEMSIDKYAVHSIRNRTFPLKFLSFKIHQILENLLKYVYFTKSKPWRNYLTSLFSSLLICKIQIM